MVFLVDHTDHESHEDKCYRYLYARMINHEYFTYELVATDGGQPVHYASLNIASGQNESWTLKHDAGFATFDKGLARDAGLGGLMLLTGPG